MSTLVFDIETIGENFEELDETTICGMTPSTVDLCLQNLQR
jgi:hypothetical protein